MKKLKHWFDGRKVSQKLMLISVFFMIPDSIMLYLFITSMNENIHFAKLEQLGNEYQRPLEHLLQLVPRQRILARNSASTAAELAAGAAQIDSAFSVLKEVDSRIGLKLDFTPEGLSKRNRQGCDVQTVQGQWKQLQSQSGKLDPAARDQAYVDLTAKVRAMIGHAGDMSNLILDPELDSYYLVDTTLMALPQTQDRLSQVMMDGEDTLLAAQQTVDQKVTLATDLQFLKEDDLDRITSSTQTALSNGNPLYGTSVSFHARVPGALKEYADAAQHFDDLTAAIQKSGPGSVSLATYLAAGHAARDASFKLWFVSDEELDHLLQNRINYYVYRRTRSLGVSASALLAAVLLVTFITRSISGPLKQQARELQLEIQERKLAEAEVAATHAKLLVISRQAGMAEVATGVLHNVGNVLNSVNVSATLIATTLRKLRTSTFAKVVALVGEHEHDLADFVSVDPRGKTLPAFLVQLSTHFSTEQEAALKEADVLQKNIEHIKEVVKMQQTHASSNGFTEIVDLRETIETVLRMNTESFNRQEIAVVREFDTVPPVVTDKHKVLQILINLVSNAGQAVSESAEKRVTVGLRLLPTGNVQVTVADTGCGIAPENLTRVFAHGFTTKVDGHGFGLHSSALAAKEMKGSLAVQSDGPGAGARFTLELPLAKPQQLAA